MGRKRAAILTDAELALMDILWRMNRATVAEVLEALSAPAPGYTSVQTRLNILVDKGYAKRKLDGRALVYGPAVERERVVSSAVDHLVSRFFMKGSALALQLISDEPMSAQELAQLEAAIAKKAKRT
jgi:predicted transcriptional regulator